MNLMPTAWPCDRSSAPRDGTETRARGRSIGYRRLERESARRVDAARVVALAAPVRSSAAWAIIAALSPEASGTSRSDDSRSAQSASSRRSSRLAATPPETARSGIGARRAAGRHDRGSGDRGGAEAGEEIEHRLRQIGPSAARRRGSAAALRRPRSRLPPSQVELEQRLALEPRVGEVEARAARPTGSGAPPRRRARPARRRAGRRERAGRGACRPCRRPRPWRRRGSRRGCAGAGRLLDLEERGVAARDHQPDEALRRRLRRLAPLAQEGRVEVTLEVVHGVERLPRPRPWRGRSRDRPGARRPGPGRGSRRRRRCRERRRRRAEAPRRSPPASCAGARARRSRAPRRRTGGGPRAGSTPPRRAPALRRRARRRRCRRRRSRCRGRGASVGLDGRGVRARLGLSATQRDVRPRRAAGRCELAAERRRAYRAGRSRSLSAPTRALATRHAAPAHARRPAARRPARQAVFVRVDFNVPLDGERSATTPGCARRCRRSASCRPPARGCWSSRTAAGRRARRGPREPASGGGALAELLGAEVAFAADCVGEAAEAAAAAALAGGVCLLENLRFHAGEEANDPRVRGALARLADAYVDDAFGAAHRAHASIVGVPERVERKAAGRLLVREVEALSRLLGEPERPFAAILGGAKIKGKIDTLENLLPRLDVLMVGGGMANTFLAARLLARELAGARTRSSSRARSSPTPPSAASRCCCRPTWWRPTASIATGGAGGPRAASRPRRSTRCPTARWRSTSGRERAPPSRPRSRRRARCSGTARSASSRSRRSTPARRVARALADCRGFTVIGGGETVAAANQAGVADADRPRLDRRRRLARVPRRARAARRRGAARGRGRRDACGARSSPPTGRCTCCAPTPRPTPIVCGATCRPPPGEVVLLSVVPPAAVVRSARRQRRRLGGQDLHPEDAAPTPATSRRSTRRRRRRWVLCGHSERRRDHGESDALVAAKVAAAQRRGLVPMLCVGETAEEREAGRTFEVLRAPARGGAAARRRRAVGPGLRAGVGDRHRRTATPERPRRPTPSCGRRWPSASARRRRRAADPLRRLGQARERRGARRPARRRRLPGRRGEP